MIFRCRDTWPKKRARLEKPHDWFAWYPVTARMSDSDRECTVWLQTVTRKGDLGFSLYGPGWLWEYTL